MCLQPFRARPRQVSPDDSADPVLLPFSPGQQVAGFPGEVRERKERGSREAQDRKPRSGLCWSPPTPDCRERGSYMTREGHPSPVDPG
ncbi:hypothetical protein CapIbe_022047 [Capra ibex]